MTTIELVEKIRRILADPEGVTESELFALASEYASRCRRLNDKLSRAVTCIRTGSLCEADRLERDWKLLENYRALTFEGAEEWREVCRSLNCEVSALASAENNAELERFIASYEESRELFAKHRRLAMTAAPLTRRLETLYQLYANFPQQQTLRRSIDALEKARVQEITDALKSRKDDAGFVQEALAELQAPTRLNRPPQALLDKLGAATTRRREKDVVAQLRDLLERWATAELGHDEAKMLETLNFYRASGLSAALGALGSDEREAMKILESESIELERQRAARAESQRKTRELEKSTNMATEVETPAPPIVEPQAAAKRVESQALQRERRGKLTIVAVVAVGVVATLVVAGILAALSSSRSQRQAPPVEEKKQHVEPEEKDVELPENFSKEQEQEALSALDDMEPVDGEALASENFSNDLAASVGSVSAYNEALDTLADSLGEQDKALVAAAKLDAENAGAIKSWNAAIANVGDLGKALEDDDAFEAAAAFIDDDSFSSIPEHAQLAEELEAWRAFGEAGGADGAKTTLIAALKPFLYESYLYYNADKDEYYYLASDPSEDESNELEYYISADGEKKAFEESVASDDIETSLTYAISAGFVERDMSDLKTFLTAVLDAIEKASSASRERIEPCARLKLLDALISALRDVPGAETLATQFDDACAEAGVAFDYDFYNLTEVKELRDAVEEALASLTSTPKMCAALREQLADALTPPEVIYELIGFVDVESGKAFVALSGPEPAEGAALYLFRGEGCEAIECGAFSASGAQLDAGSDWTQYRWSPVYARVVKK